MPADIRWQADPSTSDPEIMRDSTAPPVTVEISAITAADDRAVCTIIRQVGSEFGAVGEGFGPADTEVEQMSQHYDDQTGSLYLVAAKAGRIVGGCGVAPWAGSQQICELRKLFLLAESRGQGIGRALTVRCLEYARRQGYQACYLDTLSSMTSAIGLYEKLGFVHLDAPLEGAIHHGCDVWMLLKL